MFYFIKNKLKSYEKLVFTTGYPNLNTKVLGSYRPLLDASVFHEGPKFQSQRKTREEGSPFNKTTFNGQIIMLPSYGQNTTAIEKDIIEQGSLRFLARSSVFVKPKPKFLSNYSPYSKVLILSSELMEVTHSIKRRKYS